MTISSAGLNSPAVCGIMNNFKIYSAFVSSSWSYGIFLKNDSKLGLILFSDSVESNGQHKLNKKALFQALPDYLNILYQNDKRVNLPLLSCPLDRPGRGELR